uniref:ABC transporter domain-containing protein n=1 Tax=Alexandrium monilatum TaxID=311494 RepID=A0A7S4S1P8_9DINO
MAPPSAEDVQGVLKTACGQEAFDEDTLTYIASIITDAEESAEDPRELVGLIGDFLTDAGVAADEGAALELCKRIAGQLHPGKEAGGHTVQEDSALAEKEGPALQKPVVLSSLLGAEGSAGSTFADVYQVGGGPAVKGGIEEMPQEQLKTVAAIGRAKKEKAARRAERKAWRAEAKGEEDAVWVDVPTGVSLGSAAGGVDFHLERASLTNKKGTGDLLHDVTCTFTQGRRYGLVGRNGVGKSTLLDAVARRELPGVPACSIFYVRQEVEGDGRTSLQWVLEADSERAMLVAERERLEGSGSSAGSARLVQVYQRLEELAGDEEHLREKRAADILRGLGFDEQMRAKATQDLSGGLRMRVAIACALFVSPGLLLLDEPTNHLDLETVVWLEKYLNTEFHQTLLVVSHDRMFLNEVVTDICLFENEKLELSRGDYATFEKVREEHRTRQERLREAQEMKREHLQEYITKHAEAGSNGCKAAAQRKARMRKLERLGMEAQAQIDGRKLKVSYDGPVEDVKEVDAERATVLTFPDPGVCDSLGNALLRFDDATFGYREGPALFSGVSFSVDQSSRIAILGRNGAGKSTLIKLLLGKLKPTSGICQRHRGARVQYIAQHHLDELDGDSKPLKLALERYPGDGSNSHELRMRQHLGHFGLGGDVLPFQSIRTLSGGQKFRVSLALAMWEKPHLLVMDEPTNHLDMETIDALVKAIDDFKGGVMVVSHDQHLIASCCKELRVVANRRVVQYNGTIETYKKQILTGKA